MRSHFSGQGKSPISPVGEGLWEGYRSPEQSSGILEKMEPGKAVKTLYWYSAQAGAKPTLQSPYDSLIFWRPASVANFPRLQDGKARADT